MPMDVDATESPLSRDTFICILELFLSKIDVNLLFLSSFVLGILFLYDLILDDILIIGDLLALLF